MTFHSKIFHNVEFSQVQFVLMDIEGTTTDIDFVKKVLFPFSAKEMRNYILEHQHEAAVRECLMSVAESTKSESLDKNIEQLLLWINEDVKHPALKTLQGLIWRQGYESGEYKSHIYDDVVPAWQKWSAAGLRLGIYSSGSVAAQKLLFKYTLNGDLLKFLEAHFDLEMGGKRDVKSYRQIADRLELKPENILFLSDIIEEIEAAASARYLVGHIVRSPAAAIGAAANAGVTSSAVLNDAKQYSSFLEL